MNKNAFSLWAVIACCTQTLCADEVWLKDGSKIHGQIEAMYAGKLTLATGFAGLIIVDASHVVGITSQDPLHFALENGLTGTGQLAFTHEGGQVIQETEYGELELGDMKLYALWKQGTPWPVEQAPAPEPDAKPQPAPEATQPVAQEKSPWSARIELGINGTTGNNERTAMQGRAEANRVTEDARYNFFLEGRYARDNGLRSQNEVIGGAKAEWDLSEKTYVFSRLTLEYDEFENLDLRSIATVGIGRFLIKEESHELKARAGVGYQYEMFADGSREGDAILEFGYDYRLDINSYLRLTHSLTYYPTVHHPMSDYRLVAETAGEVPLGNSTALKLRAGVKNQYDGNPQPGIERLDTWYFMNLVYDFK